MFMRLILMVGLRDTGIILVQARGVPYVQFEGVFYIVRGPSLGREREDIPSLWRCSRVVRAQ
jgi:hypothetical protein